MRFLCDMGVSRQVSRWLCDHGHDGVHLGEQGLARLPNGDIFSKAITENRILLTVDLDFGEIVALSGGRTGSVVVFRLHNTRATHVTERLAVTLENAGDALARGAIVVVEESRIRTRDLPIGGPDL
jgi:predicted nuclease of predicted toxin-antitoxin system